MKTRRKNHRGFTMIEIALLFSILALFATTIALTVRRALQAKVADATQQLTNAGTTGSTFKLGGMKAYEPATQVADTTTTQQQSTGVGYDKGATSYSSSFNVSRSGTESTAGADKVSDDQQWLHTTW